MIASAQAMRVALRSSVLVASLMLAGCLGSVGDSVTGVFSRGPQQQFQTISLVVASTRPQAKDDTEPATREGARYYRQIVTIPPTHQPGVIEQPSFGRPNPYKHVTMGDRVSVNPTDVLPTIERLLSQRPAGKRDVLVYVHGFNTSYKEAALRFSQLIADTDFQGLPVLFTWPSYSRLFAYGADREEATASRDAMERLLTDLGRMPGVGRVNILAHSMGSFVAMEGMRQAAISGDPTLSGHLGEIILAAPDLDVAVFKAQMARIGAKGKVSLFVQANDRALAASSTVAFDRQRLGALDVMNASHRAAMSDLGVKIFNMPSSGGWTDVTRHATYAEAPAIVRLIGLRLGQPTIQTSAPTVEAAQAAVSGTPQAEVPVPGTPAE